MPTDTDLLNGVTMILTNVTFQKFFYAAMGLTLISVLLRRIFG